MAEFGYIPKPGGRGTGQLPRDTATGPDQRWFFRGFTKRVLDVSALARFSALFSRSVFPDFFETSFLGDFPDTLIRTFLQSPWHQPYLLIFFMPVELKNPRKFPHPRLYSVLRGG